jgi:hypothetical protein
MSKNQWKALALTLAGILTSLLLLLGVSLMPPTASAQVTSVSQFSDVQDTDWYFPALQSLVERWGVIAAYEDRTFRANDPETRGALAVVINSALDTLLESTAAQEADLVTQEDFAPLLARLEDLHAEVSTLRSRIDQLR